MLGKETPYANVGRILDTDSDDKNFLMNLGLVVMDGANGKCLQGKWHSHHKINDAYTAVYVLL